MTVFDPGAVRAAVADYIRENFLYARPDYELRDDAHLLDEGILDSMGAVEIVTFLQERYGIEIPDDEITEENLGSVAEIADFVGRKRQAAA